MTKTQLLRFMREHPLAVQSSVSAGGAPQAAVVGVAVTDDFELVFDTLAQTRKAQNLHGNNRIAFVLGGTAAGEDRTVQYEGIADQPAGAELDRLTKIYYGVFPDGPERLSWPGLIYVRAKPTWIRYSDFRPDSRVIVELSGPDLSRLTD
jgi:hypothetical protein